MRKATVIFTVLALVWLGLPGTLLAQQTGSISGRITAARTGDPISGEYVVAFGGGQAGEARTNAAGFYDIGNLPPGEYRVGSGNEVIPEYSEWARAYWPGVFDIDEANLVEVVAGQETTGIDIALLLGGVVRGTVEDSSTGESLPFEVVMEEKVDGKWLAGGTSWRVEDDGTYRIIGLNGEYRLTARPAGYIPVFREFAIAPEQELVVDFALEPSYPGRILGTVTEAATGHPITGELVVASGPSGWGSARTRSDGTYTIQGLPAGDYRVGTGNEVEGNPSDWVVSWWPGVPSYWDAEEVTVTDAAGVTGVDFALVFGGVVSGTVTDAWSEEPIGPDWIAISRFENGQWMGGTGYPISADGSYRIGGLDGLYRLTIHLTDYEPMEEELTIDPGESERIDFGVTPSWGTPFATVTGWVCEGEDDPSGPCDLALAGVVIEARRPDGTPLGTTTTDAGGWFFLENLDPGTIVVSAKAPAGMTMLDSPEFDVGPNEGVWDVMLVARRIPVHLAMDSWATPTEFEPGEEAVLHLAAVFAEVGAPVVPFDITGVEVEVYLPEGLFYVSHSGDGTFEQAAGLWTVPVLPFLGRAHMAITATAAAERSLRPHAEIVASDWPDPTAVFGDGQGDDFTVQTFRVVEPVEARDTLITGTVWVDEDENGIRNESDTLLSGVTVTATGDAATVEAVTTGGIYRFEALAAGVYRIGLDRDTLPADVEGEVADQTVTLGFEAELRGLDFVLTPAAGVSPWWFLGAGGMVLLVSVVAGWYSRMRRHRPPEEEEEEERTPEMLRV